MALLSILSLLQLGVLSGVFAQVGVVQVWMNDNRLQYSGEGGNGGVGWGDPLLNTIYYNNQTCGTGVRATYNESAQVSLQFNGSSLEVLFLGDELGGTAAIYLDNDQKPDVNTLDATTHYYLCTSVTFQASNLTAGLHNVTVVKDSGPETLLYIHGFQFAPSDSIVPSSTSVGPTSLVTPTSLLTAATPSASQTSQPQSVPVAKSSSNTGAIVGGVIGGIALLLLVAAAIVFFRRRNQQQPHVFDITEHTVDDAHDPQSPTFTRSTVPTPFTHQPLPQSEQPSVNTSPASSSSSRIPLLPAMASLKSRLLSSRPLPQPPSATSVARANELTAGQDMTSDQLNVVRTLVDRQVPHQTISRVIELMVAGQPVPNMMEGYDLRQAAPSVEPPPQYSVASRRP